MKTYYITKYALTRGILEVTGSATTNPNVIDVDGYIGMCCKPDWHEAREEAVKMAEQMRGRSIESAQRKLYKLHSLIFK